MITCLRYSNPIMSESWVAFVDNLAVNHFDEEFGVCFMRRMSRSLNLLCLLLDCAFHRFCCHVSTFLGGWSWPAKYEHTFVDFGPSLLHISHVGSHCLQPTLLPRVRSVNSLHAAIWLRFQCASTSHRVRVMGS